MALGDLPEMGKIAVKKGYKKYNVCKLIIE